MLPASRLKIYSFPHPTFPLTAKLQKRRRRDGVAIRATSDTQDATTVLLDRFWLSRGVNDARQRQKLVTLGIDNDENTTSLLALPLSSTSSVLGANSGWLLENGQDPTSVAEDVARISSRLLALRRLLGDRDDIDVVWMIEREPALLTSEAAVLTSRLVTLVTAAAGIDVVKLVESQPSLLLESAVSGDLSSNGEESLAQQQLAWSHGFFGDDDSQWNTRLFDLEQYKAVHGDCHVGFRDGDDSGLQRWAAKQREEHARGLLSEGRTMKLIDIGFEFSIERAEWLRWYNQLCAFKEEEGHCNPMPLAAGSDFLLLNWCAVQRIARRSHVMPEDREALLESIGFDWSGADALS